MSKSRKKKNTKNKKKSTTNRYNFNKPKVIQDDFDYIPKKKGFDFIELLRKIAVWLLLIIILIGMSSWILTIFG